MIALLAALLAVLVQPSTPPPDFIDAVLRCERAIVEPGVFVGCETHDRGEDLYAGIVWGEGVTLETGP